MAEFLWTSLVRLEDILQHFKTGGRNGGLADDFEGYHSDGSPKILVDHFVACQTKVAFKTKTRVSSLNRCKKLHWKCLQK